MQKAPEVVEFPDIRVANPQQNKYPGSELRGKYYPDENKAVVVILDKEAKVRDIISLHFKSKKDFLSLKDKNIF